MASASEARGHIGQRASLSIPGTLVLGIAMGALGGWVWLTPAVVYAGAAVWRRRRGKIMTALPSQRPRVISSPHTRSISTSDRQMLRRSSSSLSTSNCLKICCICLDDIPVDEPKVEHFDCGHGGQTHKACIDMWLKKQDTCPLCRRDVKEPVLEDMLAKPLNVDAQLKGCRFVMVKGWRNEEYQKHFLEMGAAELVLKAMRSLGEHPELQASACGAIFVLTFAGTDMQDRLAALGAVDPVIAAMRAYPWDCVLQTQGCQAVYGLARNNLTNQRSLATAGACAMVLDALDRFVDSSLELTAAGAEAIMALAFDDPENQTLLARGGAAEGTTPQARGACEILTDAASRYQGACDALYVIMDAVMKCAIEHGDNQRRFGDAGMCELIMEAMERFDSEEEFLLVALTAVYTLTDNCKENQGRVLAYGGGTGAALLIDLIERHAGNWDLLSVGLEAIFSLTYDRDEGAQLEHQTALREARVCELLLRLLKSHGTEAEVYTTAIKVAACLVASPESAERLGGAEGCGAISQVMAHALGRDDRVSVDMCCRVVTTLSSGNAEHQRLFAELGVCELTCDGIRRGLSTYEALGAIAELACSCLENKERLGRDGACELVLKMLQENFSDAVCQDSSCMALAHLCQDCPANVALFRLATSAEESRIPGGSPSDEAGARPSRICTLLGEMLRDSAGRGAQSVCVTMLALSALCTGPEGPNADCQAKCGPLTCHAAVQRLKEAAPEDELVIRHGVQLLADLALLCPDNQRVLEEAGAVEAVVERFLAEVEKEDASAASPMLQALATLAEQHGPSRQRCVDLHVLEQALQLHKRLPDDEATLDGVLTLYSTVISGNRGFQEKAVSCGICDVLVATVVHHITDSQMLTRCSSLVLALTELEVTDANGHVLHLWKSTDQSNKEMLRCAGGVSAFTVALMANQDIDDPWLISFLILVLALLADDSDSTVATLRSTGASELVSRLLQKHCAHETLPMSVAGFVSNCIMSFTGHWDVAELAELFAVRRGEQEWFLRNGSLASVLTMLRRRPTEKWMVITAMTALISLVWGNAAAVDEAIAQGALQVIASAMEERKDAPSVVFHCGLALGALTTCSRPTRDTACWAMADSWCRRPKKRTQDPCTESLGKLLKRHLNGVRRKQLEEAGTSDNGRTQVSAGATDGA